MSHLLFKLLTYVCLFIVPTTEHRRRPVLGSKNIACMILAYWKMYSSDSPLAGYWSRLNICLEVRHLTYQHFQYITFYLSIVSHWFEIAWMTLCPTWIETVLINVENCNLYQIQLPSMADSMSDLDCWRLPFTVQAFIIQSASRKYSCNRAVDDFLVCRNSYWFQVIRFA